MILHVHVPVVAGELRRAAGAEHHAAASHGPAHLTPLTRGAGPASGGPRLGPPQPALRQVYFCC